MARLYEYAQAKPAKVDAESMVIRGVKILGLESSNGRTYTDRAISDAVGLYENARVNVDHPDAPNKGTRKFAEGFGVVRGVRRESGSESPGLYGDLHYLGKHPLAEMVIEKAERFPDRFGLSHNAEGQTSRKNGKVFVESISRVESVDIVDRPATNVGLFESEDQPVKTTIKKLIEATGYKHTTKLLEMLPGEMEPAAEIDMPEVPEGSTDPVESVKAALADQVVEIFKDDAIDPVETGKQVKDLAMAVEMVKKKVEPKSEAEPEAEPTDDEPKDDETTESLKVAVGNLQESIKSLANQLAELKEQKQKPASTLRFRESETNEKYPDDTKGFVRTLKRR